jgi:hypothetical protein
MAADNLTQSKLAYQTARTFYRISDKVSDEAVLEASGVLLTVPHIYSSFH